MRQWRAVIFTAIFCIVALWTIWPYYSALALVSAIKAKDAEDIAHRIDWPSVREGLKNDLNASLLVKMREQKTNSGPEGSFANGLMVAFGPTMVNQVVDAYVTPAGVAAMLAGDRPVSPGDSIRGTGGPANSAIVLPPHEFDFERIRYAFFSGPFSFRVEIAEPTRPHSGVAVHFGWSGTWKVTRISLPLDEIAP